MRVIPLLLTSLLITGCATGRGRFLVGAGIGASLCGGGAAAFSPNRESVGMNALVFGLVGALAGGALGLLTYDDGKIPKAETSLHTQEQMQFKSSKLYLVPNP